MWELVRLIFNRCVQEVKVLEYWWIVPLLRISRFMLTSIHNSGYDLFYSYSDWRDSLLANKQAFSSCLCLNRLDSCHKLSQIFCLHTLCHTAIFQSQNDIFLLHFENVWVNSTKNKNYLLASCYSKESHIDTAFRIFRALTIVFWISVVSFWHVKSSEAATPFLISSSQASVSISKSVSKSLLASVDDVSSSPSSLPFFRARIIETPLYCCKHFWRISTIPS